MFESIHGEIILANNFSIKLAYGSLVSVPFVPSVSAENLFYLFDRK